MVSVVIPLYNNAGTITRAIQSVQSQTIQDFELIVVNDGSTDNSGRLVEQNSDKRIRLIKQQNQGVSAARNRGIEESKGEWIAFLDADDEWKPRFIETCTKLHERYPQCNILATAYERQNPEGNIEQIQLHSIPDSNVFVMDNYFEIAAMSDPPFCSISVMIKRDALKKIGGFPEGICQGEDLLTWARLVSNNKIAYSCEPLAIFHTTEAHSQGKPRRIPSKDDPVGLELEKIHKQFPNIVGLTKYIAHWHKMRASMFLRLPNCNFECRKEIQLARKWNNKIKKLTLYIILLHVPYNLRMSLLRLLN